MPQLEGRPGGWHNGRLIERVVCRCLVTGASPEYVRPVLERLAHDEAVEIERRTQRWLQRRCLLTEDDRLAIPVLGRWVWKCREG